MLRVDDIHFNPVHEVPEDGWLEALQARPRLYDWAWDLLRPNSHGRSETRDAENNGTSSTHQTEPSGPPGPVENALIEGCKEQAERIDDLVMQGIAKIDAQDLKELARDIGLHPARLWVWEQSEGVGAEYRLLNLFQDAVKDWPPNASTRKDTEKIAGKRIARIEKT